MSPPGELTHQSVIQELNDLIWVNRLPKSQCVNISRAPRNLFPVPGKKNLEQDSIIWQYPKDREAVVPHRELLQTSGPMFNMVGKGAFRRGISRDGEGRQGLEGKRTRPRGETDD